jgi:hypothetical protein
LRPWTHKENQEAGARGVAFVVTYVPQGADRRRVTHEPWGLRLKPTGKARV